MNKSDLFGQKAKKAFSLIETLMVIFIIAILFRFVSQRLYNKGQKVKSAFDKIIRLNNRLVTVSTLHGRSYRLVFQLSAENTDQYWVEKKQVGSKTENKEEGQEKQDNAFQIDPSFYSEPQSLPAILDITKIETKNSSKETGQLYIYYYPSALAQSAKIYFLRPDNQGRWVLYLDPVTKKLQVLKPEK